MGNKSKVNDGLLEDLLKVEKELAERDYNLLDCIKMERVFSNIEDRTLSSYPKSHNNLACLLFTNKYLLGLRRDLKIKVVKGTSGPTQYYTINGAQHILSTGVPLIHISGRVFRDQVDDINVGFLEKYNIIGKFLREKGISESVGSSFLVFLDEKLGVNADMENLFSIENRHEIQEKLFRQSIAFHAINNGINLVERVLEDRKNYRDIFGL